MRSLLAADPKDSVTAAAKKLVDGGNYSWKSTVDNGAGGGGGFGGGGGGPQVTEGKVASGLIWTSAPGFGGFGGGGGGGGAPANTERLFKGTNSATKVRLITMPPSFLQLLPDLLADKCPAA